MRTLTSAGRQALSPNLNLKTFAHHGCMPRHGSGLLSSFQVRSVTRHIAWLNLQCASLSATLLYGIFLYDWGDREHVFMPVSSVVLTPRFLN
jgi:hypothetical protein